MKYGENIFIEDDIIFQLAQHSQKLVMHVKAVGAIECDDVQKQEEVWDFYFGKCDLDVLNILRQFKEAYCYFDTQQQAFDAFGEWFAPKKQLLDTEQHLFVKMTLVSPDKSIVMTNE